MTKSIVYPSLITNIANKTAQITDNQENSIEIDFSVAFGINLTANRLRKELLVVDGEMKYIEHDHSMRVKNIVNEYILEITVEGKTVTMSLDQWEGIYQGIKLDLC